MKYLALQLAAFCIVLALALPYYGLSVETLSWEFLIWFVAATATLLSILCGPGWWWWIIQFCFAPLAYFLLRLQIPPIIFLVLFFWVAFCFTKKTRYVKHFSYEFILKIRAFSRVLYRFIPTLHFGASYTSTFNL